CPASIRRTPCRFCSLHVPTADDKHEGNPLHVRLSSHGGFCGLVTSANTAKRYVTCKLNEKVVNFRKGVKGRKTQCEHFSSGLASQADLRSNPPCETFVRKHRKGGS